MKRFHVHVCVQDLPASIAFYTGLFGAGPTRREADYAKWMLDDPPVNFALSARGGRPGVDHLGIQADDADGLAELEARARAADAPVLDEGVTTCCYARSDKHWVTDPQGIAWEHFLTLGDIPLFHDRPAAAAAPTVAAPCCEGADGPSAERAAAPQRAAGCC